MAGAGYEWGECRTHEYYPRVGISFPNGNLQIENSALFDSGSDHSYMSAAIIDRESLDIDDFLPMGVDINGQRHTFVEAEVSILLHDGTSSLEGTAWICFVENWNSSWFAQGCDKVACEGSTVLCGSRQTGLVSTRLIHETGVGVMLSGRNKSLVLVEESEDDTV